MKVRRLERERGWAFVVGAAILRPTIPLLTRRRWVDGEKVPATGGCVLVLNHISHVDPLFAAHFVYLHGRLPRYLAKSGLFRSRVLGTFLRGAGQIPVARMTAEAVGAYDAAVAAVRAGECVVVYPEGTITRDPDLWPMVGKTGAARIALETGCPVVPVGQWGAHEVLPPYTTRPHLWPRRTITFKVGDPVDLGSLPDGPVTVERLRRATDLIMDAVTALVADVRGERPPAVRFDPRRSGAGGSGATGRATGAGGGASAGEEGTR